MKKRRVLITDADLHAPRVVKKKTRRILVVDDDTHATRMVPVLDDAVFDEAVLCATDGVVDIAALLEYFLNGAKECGATVALARPCGATACTPNCLRTISTAAYTPPAKNISGPGSRMRVSFTVSAAFSASKPKNHQ